MTVQKKWVQHILAQNHRSKFAISNHSAFSGIKHGDGRDILIRRYFHACHTFLSDHCVVTPLVLATLPFRHCISERAVGRCVSLCGRLLAAVRYERCSITGPDFPKLSSSLGPWLTRQDRSVGESCSTLQDPHVHELTKLQDPHCSASLKCRIPSCRNLLNCRITNFKTSLNAGSPCAGLLNCRIPTCMILLNCRIPNCRTSL